MYRAISTRNPEETFEFRYTLNQYIKFAVRVLSDGWTVVTVDKSLSAPILGNGYARFPDGRIAQRPFGGTGFSRCCYAADRTGHMILQTLYQQCIKHGVKFFDEFQVVDLLFEGDPARGGRAAGVVALRLADGQLHTFRSKAVLLATGGFGRMFRITSNAWSLTGDGVALAYRHGVPMEDMEFYQFHPTGIVGAGILASETLRSAGP